jgi:hypothetical protein
MKNRQAYCICIAILVIVGAYTSYSAVRAYIIEHNKAFAHSWIKKVREVESIYHKQHGRYGSITDLSIVGLLEKEWTQVSERPYRFEIVVTEGGYEASVIPLAANSPYISYFLDESGTIKRDSR